MHNDFFPSVLGRVALILFAAAAAAAGEEPAAATLEGQLLLEPAATLAAEARTLGDPQRGAELFYGARLACLRCHAVGIGQSPLGPDLSRLPADTTAEYLVESVLAPSRAVRRGYESTVLELNDGSALTAFVIEEKPEALVIRDVGQAGRRRTLLRSLIDAKQVSPLSIMPTAQVNQLTGRDEFLHLIAYLVALVEQGPERAAALRPAGAPTAPPPTAPDTAGTQPQVYRTLMPESGPGALAIGLGHDVWICFDPHRGGINYAWIGEFDLGPTVAQKINQPSQVEGRLFYRDVRTGPWRIQDDAEPAAFQFRGYRFVEGGVTLRYEIGDLAVSDHLQAISGGGGFTRRLEFTGPPAPLCVLLDSQPSAKVTLGPTPLDGAAWRIDLRQTNVATMRVQPVPESP